MVRLRLLVFVLWLHAPLASAYPIAPRTLWSLTQEANSIVWVEVESVRMAPRRAGDTWADDPGDIARLKVLESLMGAARPGMTIEVPSSSAFICPAPASYTTGKRVLAFLFEEEGEWWTVGMSYGVRPLENAPELDVYRRVVKAAREAHALTASLPETSPVRTKARQDWHVLAARFPATRWDGLHDLIPRASLLQYGAFMPPSASSLPLTSAQLGQVAQDFVSAPSLDLSFVMTLMLLREVPHRNFDQMATRVLETIILDRQMPPWGFTAFNLMRARHGETPHPPPKLVPKPGVLRAEMNAQRFQALQLEWTAFKQRHGLKPRPLSLPVRSQPSGP
ncbi:MULTISPECIES: hypothetical protein [unclassified Myxococcus]|jgi:hypothetical protein|uniref:hypothetical protein n=1 Tax=unclassified Myxococcus TaxID=2648731 RepID=UPI001CC10812|nr:MULTISPECIES: hypothetical protein [unclassified Myxococcus]MBZ4400208.1 hypothetical protein [Myxococcus sp. AS-1-15]MBZ4407908.1 hypothetical protein [Myxococcus sp. XM-1-1-1]